MTSPAKRTDVDAGAMFRGSLAAMAGIGLAVVLWQLNQLLLVLFASVLVAVMLHDFAHLLKRVTRLPFAAALPLAVIIPLVALAIIFGLFGSLMVEQFAALAQQLPQAIARVQAWLQTSVPGREVITQLSGFAPRMEQVLGIAQATLANIGSALTGLAVVLVAAVYIAAQPRLYVDGVLSMLSEKNAARAAAAVHAGRDALTAWLKGQAIGMLFVAVGTTIGLSIIGLPSSVAIGLVAGLCEFVPYLGIVVVTIPTVILGFGQDVQTGWLTILVLVSVQQLQGNVVMPIAQRRFGDLPPVVTIFSLIASGALLGPLGVILAVPLTVVAMALLRLALESRGKHSPLTDLPAAE
ncbi:AI-2E family transporter [Sandarakinorhabdus sp.]|uniref:AI-2E family transporter n=1 Tax=Sandarakinorhabdus sp. TaxID=1916663 RepID=UPI00286E6637|nr:AI-2E family transporter [Sandarakinorhabdus sp.]